MLQIGVLFFAFCLKIFTMQSVNQKAGSGAVADDSFNKKIDNIDQICFVLAVIGGVCVRLLSIPDTQLRSSPL